MRYYYGNKLADYLLATLPASEFGARESRIQVHENGDALGYITGWQDSDGPAPTPEQVEAWRPSPLAAIAAALGSREAAAAQAITRLKASVALALMQGGMSQEATNAAGSALVVQHSSAIQAYILAGGNVVAGQALLEAIQANPPAWWSAAIAAIFTAALGK